MRKDVRSAMINMVENFVKIGKKANRPNVQRPKNDRVLYQKNTQKEEEGAMKKVAKKLLSLVVVVCIAFMGVFTVPTFGAKAAETWTLVTDVANLEAGDKVVIVAKNTNVAMSTTQNKNNRGQIAITKSGETVTINDNVQVLTVEAGKTEGTFAFNTGAGYLYAASSSSNYLRTETTLSTNSSWNITITSAGVATIKSTGTYTRNWMRQNSSNSIFSCYSSGQNDICLYELSVDESAPSVTVSGDSEMLVGGETLELTATLANVSGDVVWTSSNTEVATVENGVVTAKAMGKTTITADVNGTTGVKEVKVFPSNAHEITIAEAIAICKLTETVNSPYTYTTTGVIESIDTAYDSEYNNITVTIGDGTNSIKAFRLSGGSELAVGMKISVTGALVNYQGNTPEFAQGCTYVIVEDDDAIATMKEALNAVNPYMSLAYTYTETTKTVAASSEVVDTLTLATTGVSGTSYKEWSGKEGTSGAVYAGKSAGGNVSIQLNNNDNKPGIVTTASNGFAKKISVVWNKNTAANRILQVYGSHTAYTSAADLYGDNKGTVLGTIVNGTTELEIEGEYEYIGFRSQASAMYLDSVAITWEVEGGGEGTVEKTVYENSDFRIRFGVDAALTTIANVDSFGICVTANGESVYFSTDAISWTVANGVAYVVVDLGDIINSMASLTTEFTVQAYVEVDGMKYVSEATKTYSVATMVAEYYADEETKAAVEHLYNYLNA